MKASELMIGDWVEIQDTPKYYKIVGMEIMPKGDACRLKNDEYNCDTWCDRIKPIPLTKKILEVNGWREADCYNDMVYYLPERECLITGSVKALELRKSPMVHPRGTYDYSIRLAEIRIQSDTPLQLENVHQFQHALRLLGFDELADNFKIE